MRDVPELSVIVPAYNEAARLPASLATLCAYLEREVPSFELIVVDDGSRDATAEIARTELRRLLADPERGEVIALPRNRGKGAAVRTGVLSARGEHVLFSDADLSTPIHEQERLRAALRDGADLAIGSRGLPDARITVSQGAMRQGAGRSFNRALKLMGLTDLSDTQCGFKAFTRNAALNLFGQSRIDGFLFDVEVLYLARREGMRVVEIPVEWCNDPDSRVRMVRDFPKIVSELIRIRFIAGRRRTF